MLGNSWASIFLQLFSQAVVRLVILFHVGACQILFQNWVVHESYLFQIPFHTAPHFPYFWKFLKADQLYEVLQCHPFSLEI